MKDWSGINDLGLNTGKKTRLRRILFQHGLRNGTALFLPYDQGLEHGPRDKLNGKTDIPSDARALSPLHADVEDAVRLGADAVGYTLYVGTPAQDADFAQYRQVRDAARRLGMPLIVWAYPRGAAIDAKGGKDSFYAVDYAARAASELGADLVKVNFPHPEKRTMTPGYDEEFSTQQAIDAVVRSANRTMLLVSGGGRADDEAMLEKARQSMEAGATGLIFGRNIWQREHGESLRFVTRLQEMLAKYPWGHREAHDLGAEG